MKKAQALVIAGLIFAAAGAAQASCDTVVGLIRQGYSDAEIAQIIGVPLSVVDQCWRNRVGNFNPAGPAPRNPAGPPPVNAAGPAPRNPAGPPPVNPAGPAPRNPAGPAPRNPAGIPR